MYTHHRNMFQFLVPTLYELMLFYTVERALYNRLLRSLGKVAQEAKNVIAVWLAIEELGYHDLIRSIYASDEMKTDALFNEAFHCLEFILPDARPPSPCRSEETPNLSRILHEPMTVRFFYHNRDFLFRRFVHIMSTVCDRIFGETGALELPEEYVNSYPPFRSSTAGGAGPSGSASGSGAGSAPTSSWPAANENDNNNLCPLRHSLDTRTMFVTFSRGYPLSRQEVIEFFTSNWGEVVQHVSVDEPRPGVQPLFARVVLSLPTVVEQILNGQPKVKHVVNRKHLWLRAFEPDPRNRPN